MYDLERIKCKGIYYPYLAKNLELSEDQIIIIDSLDNFADYKNPLGRVGGTSTGTVYPYGEDKVFKLFHTKFHAGDSKICAMFKNGTVVYPEKIVYLENKNVGKEIVGTIMPRIKGYNCADDDSTEFLKYSFKELIEALEVAKSDIKELSEEYGVKLTDYKPEHTYITPKIYRIDCDDSEIGYRKLPSAEALYNHNTYAIARPILIRLFTEFNSREYFQLNGNHPWLSHSCKNIGSIRSASSDKEDFIQAAINYLSEFENTVHKEYPGVSTFRGAKLVLSRK